LILAIAARAIHAVTFRIVLRAELARRRAAIVAKQPDAVTRFYSAFFGWKVETRNARSAIA
jgi:hypothetical protein